jgi:hypothetical protein
MNFLSVLSIVSPLVIVIGCWKHRLTLLWLYAATGFCSDVSSYWIEPKQLVGNIFLLAEFVLLSFFFRDIVYRNKALFVVITVALTFGYIARLLYAPINQFQIECGSFFCLIYIVYSLFAFYKLLKKETPQEVKTTFILAETTAIYVYASGCCLLFLFASIVDKKFVTSIWGTYFCAINIFRYVMIGVALYRKPIYGT